MYKGHRDQRWGHISYSQHGDDFMILNICELLKIEKPNWLDIGAHHPVNISNTALLYDRGFRGVNVEANPKLIEAFKVMRPEDVNICTGVGIEEGTFPFYCWDEWSGRNTFSKKESYNFDFKEIQYLPMTTINKIVDNFCNKVWPKILLMDIEGLDYDVLLNAEFNQKGPDIICVEARRQDSVKFTSMMWDKGYLYYSRMGENMFFVDYNYRHLL